MIKLGNLMFCVLLTCTSAFALDPALDITQYAHKSWKSRDGFVQGAIGAIAQTDDGYLWLGTDLGLFRFDGVRPVSWQPPDRQSLPDSHVRSLLVTNDGTLWIGTLKGLASWKDGKLTLHDKLAGFSVDALLQDRNGKIWAGTAGFPPAKLCEIDNGAVTACHGEDGTFGRYIEALYEDSQGNMWVGAANGLWQWKPGPPKFHAMKNPVSAPMTLLEIDRGSLTIISAGGIQKFADGRFEPSTILKRGEARILRMLRDRHGGLWLGSANQGLTHIHQGRTDVFSQSDGLSADAVYTMFEDREANIWVATAAGLDRFHETAVSTISSRQGLSNENTLSALATNDGSIWIATAGGLNIWKDGKFQIRSASKRDDISQSLFQDRQGRIWAGKVNALGYMDNGRFVPIPGAPGGQVRSIAEDSAGNLWFSILDRGLVQVSPNHDVRIIPWSSLGREDFATAIVAERSNGGLWLGFYQGGIVHLVNGQMRESYTPKEGLGEGRTNGLYFDRTGTLWVSTERGLSRLMNGRFVTLTRKNGLPCDGVHWTIEDDSGAFWLYTPCGLVRVSSPALEGWAAAADSGNNVTSMIVAALVLDASDGVRLSSTPTTYFPGVAKSSDGKFWFATGDSVNVLDPLHLPFNKLAPGVSIERIIADRNSFVITEGLSNNLRLPPRTGEVVIEYTALSLAAPEKVQFSFMLEGHDTEWQDVGNRRYAPYGDLSPGNYRFRLRAANESGVWNEEGTFLDFTLDPAFYQATWFRVAVVAGALLLVAGIHRFRLRQVARQFNIRLEERVSERTRIARDLHDTLLQSFQGVLLKFHAITYLLPDRAADAKAMLETTIEEARRAVTEGRDTVQKLRSSAIPGNNLAAAIGAFGDELSTNLASADRPSFQVGVEGSPRDLAPTLKDEIFRIACEGLRNAFRHAGAKNIEVEIHYGGRQFRMRIRDDGKGIDSTVLEEGGRHGHYGIAGMQERARVAGGKLAIWSKLGAGTEIELLLPAQRAYAKVASKPLHGI